MKQQGFLSTAILYGVLLITSATMIYPLVFMILGGFTTLTEYSRTTVMPIPSQIRFDEHMTLLQNDLWPSIRITLIRIAFYLVVNIIVSLLGGYAFSRLRFRGKNTMFMLFLTGLVIPEILTSLPTYMMLARFPLVGGNSIAGVGGHGFINEWPALFVLGWVNVFAIFLMKQSYDMLPIEYEEAARIDGAGFFTIIFRVYLPMLRPALVAIVVITFVGIWNDYYWPQLVVAGNKDLAPVALQVQRVIYSIATAQGFYNYPYPTIFAAATLAAVPPLLVYLFLQRYFVQGLAASGIKG